MTFWCCNFWNLNKDPFADKVIGVRINFNQHISEFNFVQASCLSGSIYNLTLGPLIIMFSSYPTCWENKTAQDLVVNHPANAWSFSDHKILNILLYKLFVNMVLQGRLDNPQMQPATIILTNYANFRRDKIYASCKPSGPAFQTWKCNYKMSEEPPQNSSDCINYAHKAFRGWNCAKWIWNSSYWFKLKWIEKNLWNFVFKTFASMKIGTRT